MDNQQRERRLKMHLLMFMRPAQFEKEMNDPEYPHRLAIGNAIATTLETAMSEHPRTPGFMERAEAFARTLGAQGE